jgi:DNA-binding LytR/AlgR family response regulator
VKPERGLRKAQGDGRLAVRDEASPAGTIGRLLGISGEERRALLVYWLIGAAIAGSICLFDILTRRHDVPEQNPLNPMISEVSSLLMMAVVLTFPAAVVMWTRRRAPAAWRVGLVHLVTLLAYSIVHVSGFVLLRKIAFPLLVQQRYHFGPVVGEFLYELGKDAVAYVMLAVGCWLILQWRATPTPAIDAQAPNSFDIRDGTRLIRAPTADILAVRSAGNYAEFLLIDGRRPLMRSSLGALESQLVAHGFVRTHRSWLVNAGRVTGLGPAGSGDYTVELGEVEAPLSRRFKASLAKLRP